MRRDSERNGDGHGRVQAVLVFKAVPQTFASVDCHWENGHELSLARRAAAKAAARGLDERLAAAKRRLCKASASVSSLSALQVECTGFVFVTFDHVDAAQACIAAAAAEKKYFRGHGPLQMSMAPEPEDVIWENLQYSRAEQALRLVCSSLLILTLTIINTVTIAGFSVWQVRHGTLAPRSLIRLPN